MIIDDSDPEARIAGHQQLTGGAPCIYRIIVDPDPATDAAGEAIPEALNLSPREMDQGFSSDAGRVP
jgi:hypothetical protein